MACFVDNSVDDSVPPLVLIFFAYKALAIRCGAKEVVALPNIRELMHRPLWKCYDPNTFFGIFCALFLLGFPTQNLLIIFLLVSNLSDYSLWFYSHFLSFLLLLLRLGDPDYLGLLTGDRNVYPPSGHSQYLDIGYKY